MWRAPPRELPRDSDLTISSWSVVGSLEPTYQVKLTFIEVKTIISLLSKIRFSFVFLRKEWSLVPTELWGFKQHPRVLGQGFS